MTLATAALALTAVGTVVGVVGAVKQSQAAARAEELRKKQMNLDATRRRREIVRNATIARSQALATATAQGANAEGSTALPGAYGQIAGQAGNQTVSTNQAQQIGAGIFDANAAYARAGTLASIGGGMQSLGGSILNNYGTFQRLGWVQ